MQVRAHPNSIINLNYILHDIHLMEFTWTKSNQKFYKILLSTYKEQK